MEPHASQNVFQKVSWNFCFFDYRNKNEETPFLETQHPSKKHKSFGNWTSSIQPLKTKKHIIILCSRYKLLNTAYA